MVFFMIPSLSASDKFFFAAQQIRQYLQQQPTSDNTAVFSAVLEVLAEVHSVCDSRHPLQRTIVR